MKKILTFVLCAVLFVPCIPAQLAVSGVLDTTLTALAGGGAGPDFAWGAEEFANIRFQADLREGGAFYGAVNFIAAAGSFAAAAAAADAPLFIAGDNYIFGIELERLYFRLNFNNTDIECGLMRLPFGYSQIWGPSDFLNPRTPLSFNARPRGVLGANISVYPVYSLKIMVFASAPKDPFKFDGSGIVSGLALDQNWNRVSLQGLYSFQSPISGSPNGLHRFGLSMKADIELNLVVDALYILNTHDPAYIEGLSASAGLNYSFFGSDLYIMLEYLYNGSASSTAFDPEKRTGFRNHHYLSGIVRYQIGGYSGLTLNTVLCIDDLSLRPALAFDYEVFQGFSINATAYVSLDKKTFSGGDAGELGPTQSGVTAGFNATAKFRF